MRSRAMNEQPVKVKRDFPDDEGWQHLQETFARLDAIPDSNRREYELVQAAKRADIPLDIYRRLFADYAENQSTTDGWQRFGKALTRALDWLSRLGWIALIGIAIALSLQIVTMQEQLQYLGWTVVTLNQGHSGNGGRIFALENLKRIDGNLAGLNIEKAILPKIDLSNAQLTRANMQGAELYRANLSGANLSHSNLNSTHLYRANLSNTDLSYVNFQGADLAEVKLRGANLLKAQFKGTNLLGADLRETKNLERANLQGALYNNKTQFPPPINPVDQNAYLVAPGVDLSGFDLRGAALIAVNFEGANLASADLENADLSEAKLENANLKQTNLKQVKGLTINQVKAAQNWEQAIYDDRFRQELARARASNWQD